MLLFYFCKSFISLTSANLSSIQSRKPYINIKAILLAFHESFEWSTLDMEDSYICPKIFLKEKTSEKVNFFTFFTHFLYDYSDLKLITGNINQNLVLIKKCISLYQVCLIWWVESEKILAKFFFSGKKLRVHLFLNNLDILRQIIL